MARRAERAREHDKLVRRLATMLLKLNHGEVLRPGSLAEEFGVTLRTVQRDLNQRLNYLPLTKTSDGYRLEPAFLGRLDHRDIESFAVLAGVRGLFPSFSDEFLRDLFDVRVRSALLVHGTRYENLADKEREFARLERAVMGRRRVSFRYSAPSREAKLHGEVEPYKLLNHNGIWYLAGTESGHLKTFALRGIDALFVSEVEYTPDASVEKTLQDDDGIWFGPDSTRCVLEVSAAAAPFFRRRPLLANQEVVAEREDGSMLVSTRVGHPNEVLPHVRFWIPHVKIAEPADWQERLQRELASYLAPTKKEKNG